MKYKTSEYEFADLFMVDLHTEVDDFFDCIKSAVKWDKIADITTAAYVKKRKKDDDNGRPPYDPEIMFRIELLRIWGNLSDKKVIRELNVNIPKRRFAGISFADKCPSASTLCRFRSLLTTEGVYDEILNEIVDQLEAKGIIDKSATVIDASLTDTLRRPRCKNPIMQEDRNEEANAAEADKDFEKYKDLPYVDSEARWLMKWGVAHFGFKRHTLTDIHGLILAEITTSANRNDIKFMIDLLKKGRLLPGTLVFADRGYDSAENRRFLAENKLKARVMHKGSRCHPISERAQKVNNEIGKTRYVVERTFGSIKRWFGGGVTRYIGLAKAHAQHIMEAIAYNLYRIPGLTRC